MPIPDYQTAMLPLLRAIEDGSEHRFRDVVERLADEFQLTDQERAELLPSGTAPLFSNRVGWARTYLKQAGLIESPRRGIMRISDRGRSVLLSDPQRIDVALLDQFDEFRDFKLRCGKPPETEQHIDVKSQEELPRPKSPIASSVSATANRPPDAQADASRTDVTPEEQLAFAYRQLRRGLEIEVLEQLKAAPPSFFERVVVDVLLAMGYGGSRKDAGQRIGKSGDEGIDGIINEDRLGLDVIYIQAKRWQGVVGRPEIQKFAGALQGQRASKGVFITTSSYTPEAVRFAEQINTRIVLIDGDQLAGLMVTNNVGVSTVGVYETKRIDSDYFEGE